MSGPAWKLTTAVVVLFGKLDLLTNLRGCRITAMKAFLLASSLLCSLVACSEEPGSDPSTNLSTGAPTSRIDRLITRANQGEADAQLELAEMYTHRQSYMGIIQNYAEAMRWYRLAAEQGDAQAQSSIGKLYDSGDGVPQDFTEAMRWYRLAAEQGDAQGQVGLGEKYRQGHGVSKNYVLAHLWFNLAASTPEGGMADMMRGIVARDMTPAQITEAQRLARAWKPKTWEELKPE